MSRIRNTQCVGCDNIEDLIDDLYYLHQNNGSNFDRRLIKEDIKYAKSLRGEKLYSEEEYTPADLLKLAVEKGMVNNA